MLRIYGLQILAVAAAAIAAGLIAGALAPAAIGAIAGDVLPVKPGLAVYPLPLAVSAAYGLLIAIAFALPPLAATRHIPAAGLYRATVDGAGRIEKRVLAAVALAFAAIVALAVGTAREPLFALGFIGAAVLLLLILVALGWLVRRIASRLPRPKRPLLRLALANLHRPGAATGALVVALGLGLTLFVTLAAIQTSITAEIARTVPERAPSFFVLDIPRDRTAAFRTLVTGADDKAAINMIPALRGSVTEFAGKRVDELAELPEGAWVLRGDRGLTYSPVLPKGSSLTQGQWWARDYKGPPLVSVEADVAKSLALKIGDTLSVNVLGVEVQARVASFRTVEWDNFGLNYALVFSPGTFDAAPHNMVATVAVGPQAETALARSIPRAFPSASLIQVRDVVSQVTSLLTQMSQAIAAAASIAILAGIAVLIGAIAASRERRVYDSVILKLLGATRGQILGAQGLEYALLAAILALLALGLGLVAAHYVVVELFDFRFAPDPLVVGATLVCGAGLAFLIGIAGSWPLLSAKPAQALRMIAEPHRHEQQQREDEQAVRREPGPQRRERPCDGGGEKDQHHRRARGPRIEPAAQVEGHHRRPRHRGEAGEQARRNPRPADGDAAGPMSLGLLGHQDRQERADRDERDHQARDIGGDRFQREHAERRRRHRDQPDRHRRMAVGIGQDDAQPDRTDQQLQDDRHDDRLPRRHDHPEQRHEDDRHAETGQPSHIGRAERHRRSARKGERRQADESLDAGQAGRRSGGVASPFSIAIASASGRMRWPSWPRVRIATVPSSASRLPTTSR